MYHEFKCMKFSIGAFLFLGLSTGVYAQKVNLQWQGTETVDYGFEKRIYPKFSNEGYSVENGNVFINVKNKSNGSKVKVDKLQWTKLNSSDIFETDINAIGDYEIKGVSYFPNTKEDGEIYQAKIATLKRENNQLYRLESFEIVPEAQNIARKSGIASKTGTTNNPLKSGTFYKIKVDKSGVFRITKKFFSDNGINVNSVNPQNFRVYGNGGVLLPEFNGDSRYNSLQEVAIQMVGEEDGTWNDQDYALFYAQGPTGYNLFGRVGYGNAQRDYRNDRSLHVQNIYDDYSYYFISFDQGPGKRITEENTPITGENFTRFDEYQYINQDKFNLLKLGKVWVDDSFSTEKTVSFKTRTPILATDPVRYRYSVVSFNGSNNTLQSSINGQNSMTITTPSSQGTYYKQNPESTITNIPGNSIDLKLVPSTAANPNGSWYFDYAEVLYKQDLSFNGTQMNFRVFDIYEGSGDNYGFTMSNTSATDQIWDVSDITNVKRKKNASSNTGMYSFGYNANSQDFNNEFVAFKAEEAFNPQFVSRVENQDLASLQNIDYLVITRADMLGQAQRIADYHKTKSGYNTAVVDVAKIFNEYASGSKDLTGIRDFISDLKNNKGGLKYVLILGDASYDFKDKTSGNDNIVSAYQSEFSSDYSSSYVTDDYIVLTNPQTDTNISNNLPTIPIGRLPASNVAEAKLLVDKTLAYYNALPNQSSPFGEWRMKMDFVADDDFDGGAPFHNLVEKSIADNFEVGTVRNEYNIRKLYLDAFPQEVSAGGQRYPQVNQAISNDVGNSLYLFYFGHGGINGWAQERVLAVDEVKNFNNYTSVYSRFPLVSTITCEFTLWDEPKVLSTGEQVIKHPTGGAATMITSSRAIGVSFGRGFTGAFTNALFELNSNNDFNTLGDAHLKAKLAYGANSNHLKVNFLGDPAMKLSRPQQKMTIDQIDSPVPGKIRALDFVKISGKVLNAGGTIDANYTGRVIVNIFDKKLTKTTLNNDKSGGMTPLLTYKEENGPIVKASGKVVNGNYVVEFYVPKDINYDLGDGRILVYADNFETAKTNAQDVFFNQPYPVGEINPNGLNDSTPPTVKLFMNNTNFADGGITDQNPNLLACITDDTGINSTGSGVGHDITVILDGQVVNTTVLNDFFAPGEGNGCVNTALADYQKGNVSYPFRNLTPGPHQLTFKVWDINNNSTTATLNFVVKDESENKLVLNRLLNWPNPFTDKTYIHFEHNCDDILDVNVQIYTITGKLVRTLTNSVTAEPFREGFRTPRQAIEWDGKDDFGATVAKGTYIYKVLARSQNQEKCKGSASGVEKLVLLK